MNDPDNFFSRWSRRKQEADERTEKKEVAGNPWRKANPAGPPLRPRRRRYRNWMLKACRQSNRSVRRPT
jgi:hypothetical protein